jgi:hypothetical protein
LAADDPKEALANAQRQDAEGLRVTGVNICSAWYDMVIVEPNRADDAMREIEVHSYGRQLLEAQPRRHCRLLDQLSPNPN